MQPTNSSNNFQYLGNKHFQKLDASYQKKDIEPAFFKQITQQIFSFFKNYLRKTDMYCLSKEHNRTIMIQENLLTHGSQRGSNDNIQIKAFLKHLREKNDPQFKNISNALKKFTL